MQEIVFYLLLLALSTYNAYTIKNNCISVRECAFPLFKYRVKFAVQSLSYYSFQAFLYFQEYSKSYP